MPPIELSRPVTLAVDVVAWAAIHAGTGLVAHLTPDRSLRRDRWPWRARRWEREGRAYERLRIRRWKDRLPEAGSAFGGVSKRHTASPADDDLRRFVVETRRAELGHVLAAIAGPLFAIWNTPAVTAVMVVYGVVVNAPFVAIQRYNRLRIERVLQRRARSRSARPTSGTSMP